MKLILLALITITSVFLGKSLGYIEFQLYGYLTFLFGFLVPVYIALMVWEMGGRSMIMMANHFIVLAGVYGAKWRHDENPIYTKEQIFVFENVSTIICCVLLICMYFYFKKLNSMALNASEETQ